MPKTGSTRYQKFLKSEKSKTKLKSKELPKGTNVTKTNFKVKKIVLKEQLKKHTKQEAVSTRKLNVQELLLRLNHFNINSRTDALTGLKELITAYPEVLTQNLGTLLNKVTPLVLNIEKVIRSNTYKLLHLILSNVPAEKLEPFFGLISTYIRSAMTHIDNRIQEDSLLLLDILMSSASDYVAKDFYKILPNFLDMISKLRMDSKPGRTLTVSLDSKTTSVKWRVKVLHRLQELLHKFVGYNIVHEKKSVTREFDENKCNYFNVFDHRYLTNTFMMCSNGGENAAVDEASAFFSYIDTLMPLLFETWVEVRPSEGNQKSIETVLTEDAAILLKHILQVTSLIVTHIKYLQKRSVTLNIESTFYDKYKKQFNYNIVSGFPYVTNIRTNRAKLTNESQLFEDTITDAKMMLQNLHICRLFIIFNSHLNTKAQYKEIASVLNYLEKTFNQNTDETINNAIIDILNDIFSTEVTGWTRNIVLMNALFKRIILAYLTNDQLNPFHQDYFRLLCIISLNEKLTHFHNTDAYKEWLEHLPDILLNTTITSQNIDILHKFSVCNNKIFNEIVKNKQIEIIDNLPNIIISNAKIDTKKLVYNKLYSLLFYYVKNWSEESIDLLEKQMMEQKYSEDHYKYIRDTLMSRMSNNSQISHN